MNQSRSFNLSSVRPKTTRILQQSGVIPYRVRNGKVEVLLVTNRRHQHWVIPKGGIFKGMTAPDSAAKEAWEEAGVIGQVDTNKIGSYNYAKRGNTYRVDVFLLSAQEVLSDWPEASHRKRQWLDITKAVKHVESSELKKILKNLGKLFSIRSSTQAKQPERQATPPLKRSYVFILLQAVVLTSITRFASIVSNLGTITLSLIYCAIFIYTIWQFSEIWRSNHR